MRSGEAGKIQSSTTKPDLKSTRMGVGRHKKRGELALPSFRILLRAGYWPSTSLEKPVRLPSALSITSAR